MAWFSFIFTCDIWSFQCTCSSSSTARYFTDLVGESLLSSSLNLKLWSIFNFLDLKITNSVFFTFRLSLFAFNQLERLNRSLLIHWVIFQGNYWTVLYFYHLQNDRPQHTWDCCKGCLCKVKREEDLALALGEHQLVFP